MGGSTEILAGSATMRGGVELFIKSGLSENSDGGTIEISSGSGHTSGGSISLISGDHLSAIGQVHGSSIKLNSGYSQHGIGGPLISASGGTSTFKCRVIGII